MWSCKKWAHTTSSREYLTVWRPVLPGFPEQRLSFLLSALTSFLGPQFSRSVMSDSLWPHGLQHARLPCPSPTPGACSNSCPLSQWCHPTISSSVVPFSSCPQSFPASGPFPMSQFSASSGQIIGVSALASILPMSIQDWFPLGWTCLTSLQAKGFSRVSITTVQKRQCLGAQLALWSKSHIQGSVGGQQLQQHLISSSSRWMSSARV